MTTKKQYEDLCQDIWRHNRLYYIEHTPEISDEMYDALFKTLEKWEAEHPEWIYPGSPTQRVNESLTTGFKTIHHRTPMLSLANSYSKEEIEDFIKRIQKLVEKKHFAFSVELKMDGIAISAIYEKGIFKQGITRGDGRQGDEITANLRTIASLPLQLTGENIPDFLEVRGEVFMPRAIFLELNEQKKQDGEAEWANPRNAAAGSLKLLDPQEAARRQLSIVFYGIAEESSNQLAEQSQVVPFLHTLGLPTLEMHAYCETLEEIWAFVEKVKEIRPKLPFDIDGVVIKLNDLKDQRRLGVTGKNPRWAIAYKFSAEQAATRIVDITVQVGRTGTLTPVAELEPVFLAGSTIARATLHNEEEVMRKDIRVGDAVIIEKGGDVIPKVVEVDFSRRPAFSQPWLMPKVCPSCGSPLIKTPGEVAVRCPNEGNCEEQRIRKLVYFAGKQAMDINHLGEKIVIQLFNKGFIRQPSDIFSLTEEQVGQLTGFKAKSIHNLLSSIEKAKEISFEKFIMALGIKYVGKGTAELLAAKSGDIQTLMQMNAVELMKIEGVGEKVAFAVVEYFAHPGHKKEVEQLLALGVRPSKREVQQFHGHLFQDKSFVLTGSLENYTRSGAASLIKARGGRVTDSVSKKTDFVLVGGDPGSKLEKARSLGISILNEEEFRALLD